ncbi:hypothetical protein ACFU90_36940 [Streptomyces noursei]|uniref:Uncharacterized protein n=2 Tax=Streptomyces noursei TaxID=1971 RepID=A0A059W873_STRNR|nr:hypothetical protein [Streptomyces noursei]AIA03971.1 hypothetical protein DC74_3476 [Streptomyces noursei]AKA08723.1 hypothetical protein SAZ_18505 [Streptomyces noursei ZPM]UWS72609.1 hypothetical protein N1H47_15935 [Streptomyces noursei]GCB91555.1 hypothetical protein SALB_04290 [Streptomyces noursei]
MTVPAPRRTAPGPQPAGPGRRHRAGRTAAAVAVLGLLAATAAAAPAAPDAPTGCGVLVRGRLCLRGPVGAPGRYTAVYRRDEPMPGELTVRLGYQRKNSRITAFPGWFGTGRTQGGTLRLSGRVEMLPDECIRGVMEHTATVFVTKWSCG